MSNVENLTEVVESLEEVSLEAPKVKKPRGRPKALVIDTTLPEEPVEESPPKKKRVQTEAQKANFQKALEKRKANIELRKAAKLAAEEAKEQEQEVKKKEVERKVVKKAICIKKKEILSQVALDEISDCDDIPNEVVEKIVKRQRAKSLPKSRPVAPVESPKPKYTFV
jgi:hypothetical protein